MFDPRLTKPHYKTVIFAAYLELLAKNYPHINIENLVKRAGLSLEYLRDENKWVSVTFEKQIMDLIVQVTNEPALYFQAGELGVSRTGLGASLYFLVANVIPLDTIYKTLPKLTSLLNKVMTVEVVEQRDGFFKFLFTPKLEELDEEEREILISRMPFVMENTKGYYGKLPTAKGFPPGNSAVELVDAGKGIYSLKLKYFGRTKMLGQLLKAVPIFAFGTLAWWFQSHYGMGQFESIVSSFAIVMTLTTLVLWIQNHKLGRIAVQEQESMFRLDTQNKDLYDAKTKLQRKLEESQATYQLVSHLISASTESEVLQLGCECLVDNLHYDRAFILSFDDRENCLRLSAAKGLTPDLKSAMQGMALPVEISDPDPAKFTNVFRTRQPLLVKDVRGHMAKLADPKSMEVLKVSGSRSFVAAPIFTKSNSLGILVADCVSKQKIMTEDDLRLVSTAAQQIAIAMEQLRAKQQLVDAYQKEIELSESYSRFVPFETLKLLNYKSIFDVKLGDYVDRDVAIMFSDIRGFTTLGESMSPSDILKFLNSYYARLSPIIKAHQGTIDKYMGDGVMAIFPSAENAVAAAVDIQRSLFHYNLEHRVGSRVPVRAGVGVATGRVVFGPLGSDKRLELTAIADTVNVASRLDGLCRESGQNIMVTGIDESIIRKQSHLNLASYQPLKVKGRAGDVHVIAITDNAFFDGINEAELNPAQKEYVAQERQAWLARINSTKAA